MQSQIAGWLTAKEFRNLEAICDTLLPSLDPPAGSSEAVTAYYRRSAGDLHIALLVAETLAQENEAARSQFRQLMSLMSSPVSGLLLIGVPKAFVALSFEQR